MSSTDYEVVVIGGGAVGLAAAYEVAKAGTRVIVLEQNAFFNQAGSSGDLCRMFRTMYTEDYMANLAKDALDIWDDLERDAGVSLRWMGGLLNFGDPDYGGNTPEGTLLGPIPNLKRLKLDYKTYTADQIEKKYPFKNLPKNWMGLFATDNGVINVPLLLRTLYGLAKDYGAEARQYREVTGIIYDQAKQTWIVNSKDILGAEHTYSGKKIIIASGAYVNHVLEPSFNISLDLDIWEMVASYFTCNAGPSGAVFPSMWFQFAPDDASGRSQLMYGFPTVSWGMPNIARIAVDAATRRIRDPNERMSNVINPADIKDIQDYINEHIVGVDATVPAYSLSCLQTNVFDNMFVLDYLPKQYLKGGPPNTVAIFTAGWGMKFSPLLGKALKEMVLDGGSSYALKEFLITRKDKDGKGIIVEGSASVNGTSSAFSFEKQAYGSSMRGFHNMGH